MILLFTAFLLVHSSIAASDGCRGSRPGDCDPNACGGTCEARYIRFYDSAIKGDRTAKSCQCQEEKLCQIICMHAYAGCRSYATLSTTGQRLIRLWSMDIRDRRNRFSNDVTKRYSDKQRHTQLMYANSRFCCRTSSGKVKRPQTLRMRARALRLRSGSLATLTTTVVFVALMRIWYFTV